VLGVEERGLAASMGKYGSDISKHIHVPLVHLLMTLSLPQPVSLSSTACPFHLMKYLMMCGTNAKLSGSFGQNN
jgi:hypothetical protein